MGFTKLVLRPICEKDVSCFDGSEYEKLTKEKRLELIVHSQNKTCGDKYFEFFLLEDKEEIIGFMSLSAHTDSVISVAPEIKEKYRNKGYATEGEILALEYAKRAGYKIAMAGVKEDNTASVRLHEKLNFEYVHTFTNKNGKTLKLYLKSL